MIFRKNREDQGNGFGSYQPPSPQYQGITTRSVYIPMRDGVRLAVEVVLPKDLPPGTRLPALLSQTRYWRAMELRAPFKWFLRPEALDPDFQDFQPFFTSHGYALINVDVRGTGASFGTWPHPWAAESLADAREIVDWIVAQPWSNGKVGGHGISYLGTTAELLAALEHPAVKCTIPMFNHPDAYIDIALPGGVLNERFMRAWSDMDHSLDANVVPAEFGPLGRLLMKGVKPVDGDDGRALLRAAVRAHQANEHAYRLVQSANFRDQCVSGTDICIEDITVHRHQKAIRRARTPTCGWGSWMDAGTAGAVIRRFLTYEGARRAVIGAWEHGGRFQASPYRPSNLAADPPLPVQWREMLRFLDAYLKDADNGVRSEKVLFYYTLGEERWKRTGVWPPQGTTTQRWYLAENGTLSPTAPDAESGADSFTIDFRATTGDYNRWWELSALERKTVMYRRRAEAGQHMLTYTTPTLAEDTEITGYPVITLHVSSTETDGTFFVYLEDVDESGSVTYITEGQLRAIHRRVSTEPPPYTIQVPYHSFKEADAMPLVPGEMAELSFGLSPTSVLIRKGHRIRVGVAGHDAGTFARIPARGTPVIMLARNRGHASYIDLPVVPRTG
jgi:putative CocE/NonD family hydrolase